MSDCLALVAQAEEAKPSLQASELLVKDKDERAGKVLVDKGHLQRDEGVHVGVDKGVEVEEQGGVASDLQVDQGEGSV